MGLLFFMAQVKYVLLGDVGIRPTDIERNYIIQNEFLSMWVLIKLYHLLQPILHLSGMQIIQYNSYLCGTLFVFFALLTANQIGRSFATKAAAFVASTLSLAALMQFCGYSESYAIDLLLLQIYLYTAILHIKKHLHVAVPAIVCITGVAAHSMLAYMLPSLMFLFYRQLYSKYPLFRQKNTFVVLGILAIVVGYFVHTRVAVGIMLPFHSDNEKIMTMFSPAHWTEFLNAQLLGGGVMSIAWVGVLLYVIVGKKMKLTALHWFLIIASISVTGFLLVADLWRGSGDWDIYSFGAVVNNLMVTCILLDLHEMKIIRNAKYGLGILCTLSVLHTTLWIITNASDKSIIWTEKAFQNDPACYYQRSFSSAAMLAAAFGSNGLTEKSLHWHKVAYTQQPNDPRYGYNYAGVLQNNNQIEEAIAIYEKVVQLNPLYPLPYLRLVNVYLEGENYDALYILLDKMKNAYQLNPQAFTGRLEQAQIDYCFNLLQQLRPLTRAN
jgi:hypothetical protein